MQGTLNQLEKGKFAGGAYEDIGKGFPVMLVHGFPADHTLWENQIHILAKKYRLILPDLPGTSQSPPIKDISIAEIGGFFKAILDQEKIEKCIIIGHSMGGYATLAFAGKYPEYLSGWGLFHSSAYPDDEEKKRGRKRSISMMERYGQKLFLEQMLPNLFSKKSRRDKRALVKKLIQTRTAAGIDALIPYYHAMWQRPDKTQVLKDSNVPVLFVIGKEDTAAPLERVIEQVVLPKISQIHIFEEVGHLCMLEKPKAATQVLDQFIDFCLINE